MRKSSLHIFLLILFSFVFETKAQDAHYWTEQYGTKSMLLSNSVVGSVSDLGAVFYNPGRLGLIENPAFVISAKVHQLSNTKFENATGDNKDLKKSKFGSAPSLVAGTFKVKWLPGHKFAYSFLTRNSSDTDFATRNQVHGDVIEGFVGEEYFSGSMRIGKKFKEEWMGVTWSKVLGEKASVGISGFFSTRNQSSNLETRLQAFTQDEILEMYHAKNSYSFKQYGLVFKAGFAYEWEKVRIGTTMTSPTIPIAGDGDFYYEQFNTGYLSNNAIYELDSQGGIDAIYKTPWAVALGLGVDVFTAGTLHFSSEYYGNVDPYAIMQAEPFVGQSTGKEWDARVVNQLNSVINFGVGYNFRINDKIGGYLSYSTDFSAAQTKYSAAEARESLAYIGSTFKSDVQHFAFGVLMDLSWADITLGATNASANYEVPRPIDFPDGEVDAVDILSSDEMAEIDWSRWRFIVGISIPFISQIADKLNL
ncbi:hypothetical protein [Carboxylicivirga sp. M1479]|uniref:hypothetical protein n=1 Tax=Carboxylicivirga sp. M1479 TaxID=2594476 RepID=UPI001177CC5E|nr:hypothetical protein [Carboxylicivirga sp. M1479]TRX70752.1 hypothetical protein FNN09_09680 [Carboxylicivirga sp. M1479]